MLNRSGERADAHTARYVSLTECKNWLQGLPFETRVGNRPLERLEEVIDLLVKPASREQREMLRPLLGNWDVPQKKRGRKRRYDEIKDELAAKACQETRRLKRLQGDLEEGLGTNIGADLSAIQASLRHRELLL